MLKKNILSFFLINSLITQNCSYGASFKLINLERVYPLITSAYTSFTFSVHEELYSQNILINTSKHKIKKENDYSIADNSIKYINGLKVTIQRPIYNNEEIITNFEILQQKFIKFDLIYFTIYNNSYYLPEMPIKFLLFNEFCNYKLSMLELDNVKVIKTPNGGAYDGTLVFTFNFDNFLYVKMFDHVVSSGKEKSKRLVQMQKKLAIDYKFENFKSFGYVRNK